VTFVRFMNLLFVSTILLGLAAPSYTQPIPNSYMNNWLDYQIVWQLGEPTVPQKDKLIKPIKSIYSIPLLPKKLFLTTNQATTKDNTMLLLSNVQLMLMESKLLMACSLRRGSKGSVAEKNRVCLIDENSDGEFDSYLLRAFRSSLYEGEGHKFALAGRFEDTFKPVNSVSIKEISPKLFSDPDMLEFYFANISDKKQQMLVYTHVDTLYALGEECGSYMLQGGEPSKISCSTAGALIRVVGRQGKSLNFNVSPTNEMLDLRFQYAKGMLDYRITGFLIYPRVRSRTLSQP
jgi:hypothetical protein